jgi:hypothetical protein
MKRGGNVTRTGDTGPVNCQEGLGKSKGISRNIRCYDTPSDRAPSGHKSET